MAKTLIDFRAEKGLYLKDVAEAIDISQEELSQVEKLNSVPDYIVEKLIVAYNLPENYFSGEKVEQPIKPIINLKSYFFKTSLLWYFVFALILSVPVSIVAYITPFMTSLLGLTVTSFVRNGLDFLADIIIVAATIVYCNLIRQVYKQTPIVIGGIEASLRRLAHYDYWSDKLKRSILLESGADIISYGMGERSIVEIAEALDSGIAVKDITYIDGTVVKMRDLSSVDNAIMLPSYDQLQKDKLNYAKSFYTQYCNTDPFSGRRLVEPYSDHLYVVQNPPAKPLSQSEMDRVYSLP